MTRIDHDEPAFDGEDFPFPMCIIRVSDQVVVNANKAGLELFGYTLEDLKLRSLWDIVAHIDWDLIVREASRSRPGGEDVDVPSSGLLNFRHADGSEFVSWFRVRDIPGRDGTVRYRAAILLESDLSQQSENMNEDLALLANRNYFSQLAGDAAHEVNSSLVILQDLVAKLAASSEDDRLLVDRALTRLKDVGSRLTTIGNKGKIDTNPEESTETSISRGYRTGNILVVEDETDLSVVIVSLLKSAGFSVCSAVGKSEALECFKKGVVDCALVDVQLGDELGTDLAKEITKMSPSTQVIMMSGFSRHIEKLLLDGEYPLLRKPFAMFDLLELIQKAMPRE